MSQSLVDKVARTKQLMAIAHPEILILFENWLEELEDEVLRLVLSGSREPVQVAEAEGLSRSGADFVLAKLRHEGRIK